MDNEVESWHELPLRAHSRPAVCLPPEVTLAEVARAMQQQNSTAVLIREGDRLLGILTDKDLRRATAAGTHPSTTLAREWMSAPVQTFHEGISLGAAQIAMLRFEINHLVITADGSESTQVEGVVSQRDILVTQSHNPTLLLRHIRQAPSAAVLRPVTEQMRQLLRDYLEQGIPLPHVMEIFTALKDALTGRLLDLALEQYGSPGVSFSWWALGSLGRGEQLLLTDQDSALVFEDVSEHKREAVRTALLQVAKFVNEGLGVAGYPPCPAGMMASNPKWCLTAAEWKDRFSQWMEAPDEDSMLLSSVFLDARPVFGDHRPARAVSNFLEQQLPKATLFQAYLGVSALNAPPARYFWGHIIRERNGAHRGRFDLKARALLPLVDAARLLCLAHGNLHLKNTGERLEFLSLKEPQNTDLYDRCRAAFLAFQQLRTRAGLRAEGSGRYIDLSTLRPIERKSLARHLKCLPDLRQVLEQRFRLSGMR